MLTIFFFMVISAAVFLWVGGVVQSLNQEEAFFMYLYSGLVLSAGVGGFTYFAYNDFWTFNTNIQDITSSLAMLWLFTSLIALIILIINFILKKSIVVPVLISSVSFALFSITLSVYLTVILF